MGTSLTSEIIDKIFRKPDIQFGLSEFDKIKPFEVLTIFEKEKGKFYLRCLKRNIDLLVWNEEKQSGEPEEIVRQLWLCKLTKNYNYPLDRIAVEKDVAFGSNVHEKAADIEHTVQHRVLNSFAHRDYSYKRCLILSKLFWYSAWFNTKSAYFSGLLN